MKPDKEHPIQTTSSFPVSGGETASRGSSVSFHSELQARVQRLLQERGLKPHGSYSMLRKSIVLMSCWSLSYALLLTLGATGWLPLIACSILVAAWTGMVEFGIMHDASHSSISPKSWINTLGNLTMIMAGAAPILWYHKHVIAHHGNTNIPGRDHDIDSGGLFRFHAGQHWRWYHRWQPWYALPAYGLLIFKWVWVDDAVDVLRDKYGIHADRRRRAWVEIAISRLVHFTLYIALPWMLLGAPGMLVFYFLHWYLVGVTLAVVFQLAHVTGAQAFPSDNSLLKQDWAVHQLSTTADFATRSWLLTWMVGGLNHQVEHHIFPGISHARYRLIQPVIRDTCREFGVQYHEYPTFFSAVRAHFAHLIRLSRPPQATA